MLTFKPVTIIFLIALIILSVVSFFAPVPVRLLPVILLVYLALLLRGSFFIESGYFLKAYCQGETDKREIALTFDDGPDENITPEVLDVLREYNAKGNFFCIGKQIEANPGLLKKIDLEDHIIGSHSYTHSVFFDFYSKSRVISELKKTEALIKSVTGKKINFFRPPFGVTNPPIRKAVDRMNYKPIGWNVRSMDTVITNEEKLLKRVTGKIKPGAIILFHDNNPRLPAVLRKLLQYCKENNFKCVRLDELLKLEAYG